MANIMQLKIKCGGMPMKIKCSMAGYEQGTAIAVIGMGTVARAGHNGAGGQPGAAGQG